MNHNMHMTAGCALPLLLVFLHPIFGITGSVAVGIALVVLFAGHLLMMRGTGSIHSVYAAEEASGMEITSSEDRHGENESRP